MSSVFVVKEKRFTKYFYKNFACFAGKKHTLLHETVLGGVLFFKSMIYYTNTLLILILILLLLLLLGTYSTQQVRQSKKQCVVNFTIGFVDTLKSMT